MKHGWTLIDTKKVFDQIRVVIGSVVLIILLWCSHVESGFIANIVDLLVPNTGPWRRLKLVWRRTNLSSWTLDRWLLLLATWIRTTKWICKYASSKPTRLSKYLMPINSDVSQWTGRTWIEWEGCHSDIKKGSNPWRSGSMSVSLAIARHS
jgi:hypothetical protein